MQQLKPAPNAPTPLDIRDKYLGKGNKNIVSIPLTFRHFYKHAPAALLKQILFLSDKGKNTEWFYKIARELAFETGLSIGQVNRYVKIFEDDGLITTKVKNVPYTNTPSRFFYVHWDAIDAKFSTVHDNTPRFRRHSRNGEKKAVLTLVPTVKEAQAMEIDEELSTEIDPDQTPKMVGPNTKNGAYTDCELQTTKPLKPLKPLKQDNNIEILVSENIPIDAIDVLEWVPDQKTQWAVDDVCEQDCSELYYDDKLRGFCDHMVKIGKRFSTEDELSRKLISYFYRGWVTFEEGKKMINHGISYYDRTPWSEPVF